MHQLELDFQNEELLSSRAELEAACDRQLQLRDASPGAKLVLDEKGCVIEGNALAQQHLHASGPTLVGKALIGWLATADVPRVQAWLTQALARLDAMSLAWTLRVPSHEGREVIAAAHAEARKSITARMWAYRSITTPIDVFDFTVSRHRDGPESFLDGFTGTLMADCYAGYDAVQTKSDERIVRGACVTHARRKVFNARDNHPAHAAVVLSMFQQLYDIEDRAKDFSADDRKALRQAEAKPIWERIREYVNGDAVANVLPKETFAQALTYLRNQFDHLLVYLDDGLMPIDNNLTEQLMKKVAIGRKNWLFIGEVEPGYRAADLFTIVSSAVRNDLDVFAYVKDVLDRLLAGETDYEALRPDVCRQAHPEAVRTYREEERAARADVKKARRARRRVSRK